MRPRQYIEGALLALFAWTVCAAPARTQGSGSQSADRGPGVPAWLPGYKLDIHLDLKEHFAKVRERVTWTNRHHRPAEKLVFNAHAHYRVSSVGLLAKTLEILRMAPGDSIDEGPALHVDEVRLGTVQPTWHYMAKKDGDETDNDTALLVNLPRPIVQGESVTLDVEFTLNLPQKQ